MPVRFFDTNVLLYLVADDSMKAARAEALVADGGVISVQVLNEIANVGRHKMRLGWAEVDQLLETLTKLLDVRALTLEIHVTGLAPARRHALSIYDAMIVASALEARCTTLWSEDMHHGLLIADRLTIANPFRSSSNF